MQIYETILIISLKLTAIIEQMQKSRDRDFSNTRLSYSRNQAVSTDRPTLSPSRRTTNNRNENNQRQGKICINCYNHQLSLDKHNQKLLEESQVGQGQALTLSKFSKDNGKERELHKNEAQKVNEFNLKKIQENQRKRQEQRDKNKDQDTSQQQLEHLKDLEQRRQLQEKRRNKLREDLEKQITFTKQRRQQQAQQNKNNVPRPIISKPNNENDRQLMESLYKQELLKQINQKKNKRFEEAQQNRADQENQLYFIVNAQNKRKDARKQQASFKQMTRAEMQKKMDEQRQKKHIYANQRQQQAKNRQNEEKRLRQTTQQTQHQRRDKIQRYICDLKRQMQENATKRNQQFQWIAKTTDNCILGPKKQHNLEPCSCCRKQTPNRQLSPYIREMKKQ